MMPYGTYADRPNGGTRHHNLRHYRGMYQFGQQHNKHTDDVDPLCDDQHAHHGDHPPDHHNHVDDHDHHHRAADYDHDHDHDQLAGRPTAGEGDGGNRRNRGR